MIQALSRPLGKVLSSAKNGTLLSILYQKFCLMGIPRWRGAFWLRFYRWIYPNFQVGNRVHCWGRILVWMGKEGSIEIGDDGWIVSDNKRAGIALYSPCKLRACDGARIVLGKRVALNGVSITSRKKIVIEEGTIIAPNVIIVDSDFHRPWPPEERFYGLGQENDREVHIGKNVWIGMNSIILKGVTIGDNAMVAAGSVVTKPVPPNAIVAGVPARVVRELKDETIKP